MTRSPHVTPLTFVREAVNVHAPDEAYRIWCPNCAYVLAEYMHGVARYLCRSCKWEGVIAREGTSLVMSYVTLRLGRRDAQQRGVNLFPSEGSGGPVPVDGRTQLR